MNYQEAYTYLDAMPADQFASMAAAAGFMFTPTLSKVEKIQEVLKENGLRPEEEYMDDSDIGTCGAPPPIQKMSYSEALIRLQLMPLDEIRSRATDCAFVIPSGASKEQAIRIVMDYFKDDAGWFLGTDDEDAEGGFGETDEDAEGGFGLSDDDQLWECIECGKECRAREMDEESNKCAECYNSMDGLLEMGKLTLS